jgi:hypothetical protein
MDNLPNKRLTRPIKFGDAVELKAVIDKYFDGCDANKKPYLQTGLARALGTSRDVLIDYANGNNSNISDEIVNIVRDAKARVMEYAEGHLFTGTNVTGAIFSLKNQGWRDQVTVEHDVSVHHEMPTDLVQGFTEYLKDSTRQQAIDAESTETDVG